MAAVKAPLHSAELQLVPAAAAKRGWRSGRSSASTTILVQVLGETLALTLRPGGATTTIPISSVRSSLLRDGDIAEVDLAEPLPPPLSCSALTLRGPAAARTARVIAAQVEGLQRRQRAASRGAARVTRPAAAAASAAAILVHPATSQGDVVSGVGAATAAAVHAYSLPSLLRKGGGDGAPSPPLRAYRLGGRVAASGSVPGAGAGAGAGRGGGAAASADTAGSTLTGATIVAVGTEFGVPITVRMGGATGSPQQAPVGVAVSARSTTAPWGVAMPGIPAGTSSAESGSASPVNLVTVYDGSGGTPAAGSGAADSTAALFAATERLHGNARSSRTMRGHGWQAGTSSAHSTASAAAPYRSDSAPRDSASSSNTTSPSATSGSAAGMRSGGGGAVFAATSWRVTASGSASIPSNSLAMTTSASPHASLRAPSVASISGAGELLTAVDPSAYLPLGHLSAVPPTAAASPAFHLPGAVDVTSSPFVVGAAPTWAPAPAGGIAHGRSQTEPAGATRVAEELRPATPASTPDARASTAAPYAASSGDVRIVTAASFSTATTAAAAPPRSARLTLSAADVASADAQSLERLRSLHSVRRSAGMAGRGSPPRHRMRGRGTSGATTSGWESESGGRSLGGTASPATSPRGGAGSNSRWPTAPAAASFSSHGAVPGIGAVVAHTLGAAYDSGGGDDSRVDTAASAGTVLSAGSAAARSSAPAHHSGGLGSVWLPSLVSPDAAATAMASSPAAASLDGSDAYSVVSLLGERAGDARGTRPLPVVFESGGSESTPQQRPLR